ncbi:hypothetical protein SAY87_025841 [Trapa incisa]|uniref:cytokinin dehydrogenase n=1 Tax=Trapa incisa TaxID=236973 RepID=A0AAN7GYR3_9MYRT|nr:hypothetical protein SAY87_025841 [Trapa incisa]
MEGMRRYPPMAISTYLIVVFIMSKLINMDIAMSTGHLLDDPRLPSLPPALADKLRTDNDSISLASTDYGNIIRQSPLAVLRPSSTADIISLVQSSYVSSSAAPLLTIAARGVSHSVQGQAMARCGVVVDMPSSGNSDDPDAVTVASIYDNSSGEYLHYADVRSGVLWIDVLRATIKQGLAPVSWTDYLYLTVGGTLSNAGISGQTFRHGPQINNVLELDVITGRGEFFSGCSRSNISELFYAVLGGLGQFGIITRARIVLGPVQNRVKWIKMLYNDFSAFTRDQERLISINGKNQSNALNYLEGNLLMNQGGGSSDNWWPSSFPESDVERISSLVTDHGIVYCIEAAKYYDNDSRDSVLKDLDELFTGSGYVPGFKFERDVSLEEFLGRVRLRDNHDQAHPWLNLFVPKSRFSDFDNGVFKDIVLRNNITTGLVLVYPMNRTKWDNQMSASIPDEEVFYAVGFLHSSGLNDWQRFDRQNKQILQYCKDNGINVKQYLPQYHTKEDWESHFGSKWRTFLTRKSRFDPKMILSPGQRIFT